MQQDYSISTGTNFCRFYETITDTCGKLNRRSLHHLLQVSIPEIHLESFYSVQNEDIVLGSINNFISLDCSTMFF